MIEGFKQIEVKAFGVPESKFDEFDELKKELEKAIQEYKK